MSLYDYWWIPLIAFLIVFIIAWWWLVWVCVGILMSYYAIPGGLLMQIFLWFMINGVIGGIGKIGTSKS
jgi:hypothetical protein